MNLGIVADEIDRDFAKAVSVGAALGINRYEVRHLMSGRAPMCDVEELRAIEGTGVEITALSPGLFKHTEDEAGFSHEMANVYPRAAEWAKRWRLPGLIVFGFLKPAPEAEQVLEWLARASEHAEKDDLLLMIEPEPICWCDTARITADLIERSGARNLRINYDPGNVAWFEGRDPIDEFDAASKWIANVHVKDLLPGPQFVTPGEGMIEYGAHFAALKRIGYNGPISLEPHMDGRPETIRRCKEAVEKLYGSDTARSD